MHGYDLHQQVQEGLGEIWTIGISNVYGVLKNLEQAGHVESSLSPQENRPPRKVFSITPEGRKSFLAWLQQPTVDGYSLAMIHGDNEEVLSNLINSGRYAYVFYGHTHRRQDRTAGRTRAINPGALGGRRWQSRSFCILDLATGKARFVEI